MSANLKYEVEFKSESCWHCQMPFGVTSYFMQRRREDHRDFYCPAGHAQCYPAETDIDKERRKSQVLANQVRMEREQREKAERKLRRIEKGTCPHCNRSFANVARHMKSQHKECK